MKNNPTLTNEQRRKQNLLKTWGIEDGPHNPDFRNIIRNAVYEADAEKKKSNNYYPGAISIEDSISHMPKVDVASSITKRRLEYEHNNNFEKPEKGIGELLNTTESNND